MNKKEFVITIMLVAMVALAIVLVYKVGYSYGRASYEKQILASNSLIYNSMDINSIIQSSLYNYTNNLDNGQLINSFWDCGQNNNKNVTVLMGAFMVRPLFKNGSRVVFNEDLFSSITQVALRVGDTGNYMNCSMYRSFIKPTRFG